MFLTVQADVGRSGQQASPKPVEGKGSATSAPLAAGTRARVAFEQGPGRFLKGLSARHKPFFFSYANIQFSIRGKYRTDKLGRRCGTWCRARCTCFAKLGWALGAEKGLSCHCTEELFLRNQKLPCRRPRGRLEPGRPAGNRPPLKVRLLRGIVRTRVATCHPAPSQSVCP